MSASAELVLVERKDRVAIVTLNRPDAMNALSAALRARLAAVFRQLAADDTIHAVVLTGAGNRAFCAGLDLKELGENAAAIADATAADPEANPVAAVRSCGKPVIAAINGVAITGGLELALACDILIAGENARFADTHARVGVMPGWGLSQELSRRIGLSRAMEMSLSGNFIDARLAAEWALVNRVVPTEDLLAGAVALAGDIAQVDPGMVSRYRALIHDGYRLPFGEGLALEHAVSTADNRKLTPEGIAQQRGKVLARGRSFASGE